MTSLDDEAYADSLDEPIDLCRFCEGNCKICANRYQRDPDRFEGWPSDEQMERFKRGGKR